jgi:hypothetical protein
MPTKVGPKERLLQIRMDKVTHKALKIQAIREDRTISSLVRLWVKERLAKAS